MSTYKKSRIRPDDWITPAEAARLRGVTRQAITKLIRAQRVAILQIAGRRLVKRADILNFKRKAPGRISGKQKGSNVEGR